MASSSSSSSRVIRPGPEDASLLTMQETHISQYIWNGHPDRVLVVRGKSSIRGRDEQIPIEIIPYLEQAGFLEIAKLEFFQIDQTLISALVERWRPETHTFHLPPGECTITLQDIAIQTGLRIDGMPVAGNTSGVWQPILQQLLGVTPPQNAFHGHRLKMGWLNTHFSDINDHNDNEVQVQRFARAYILRLMGSVLFPDHSGNLVPLRLLPFLEDFAVAGQYSWGSAVLSYLYRELCKCTDYNRREIGGMAMLVQLWAWDRFPSIAPTPSMDMIHAPLGARYDFFLLLFFFVISFLFT